MSFALAACVGVGPDGGNGQVAREPLDCVKRSYPCTWAEATPEAVARTDAILTIAAALIGQGDSIEEIAESLSKSPDMEEVSYDPFGLMFRVTGGIPATVDADPTGDGQVLSGGLQSQRGEDVPASLPALTPEGAFTGCASGEDSSDGLPGVARKPGEGKHALLLSPWQFGLAWDIGTLRDNLQLPGSKYNRDAGGSITSRASFSSGGSPVQASQENVTLEDFCGWEAYDTIILMTHGRALCASFDGAGSPQECITSFAVGEYSESEEELKALVGDARGVIVGVSRYGAYLEGLTDEQRDACRAELEEVVLPDTPASTCFQLLPEPVRTIKVTTDFFRANYPNGLPDRLIFLAACQGMKFGDMGTTLGVGQGSGQILGFNQIALLKHAQRLLKEFTERLGQGERIGSDYKRWANNWLDDNSAAADLYDYPLSDVPGGELGDLVDGDGPATWGSDVVSIMAKGAELKNGGVVGLANPPPSGDRDALRMTLRLSDVEEGEAPEDFDVTVLWNDQPTELDDLIWIPGDRKSFTATAVVKLPRKLEPDEEFDLEIRGILPAAENAPTWWRYTEITAEPPSACELLSGADGDAAVSDALGVSMNSFDTEGIGVFFGDFCGWQTPALDSQITLLVYSGAAAGFRADFEGSPLAVDGFGDVAIYDSATGRGDQCSSIKDNTTGTLQWVCFVNLTVAMGKDTVYFTLEGNVVGNNGPSGSLAILRDLVASISG